MFISMKYLTGFISITFYLSFIWMNQILFTTINDNPKTDQVTMYLILENENSVTLSPMTDSRHSQVIVCHDLRFLPDA